MVESNKVEVYLVRHSDGVRYNEYTAPPGTLKHTGNPNEKYIEVGTDERFRIVVKLLPKFNFMGHTKVRVEYFVDRGGLISQTLSERRTKPAPSTDRSHREAELQRVRRFINGQWMSCGFAFGELKTDDSVSLGDHQIIEEADRTGRIVVKLRRGHFAQQKATESTKAKSFDPPEYVDLEASCKEVVRKHQVSHVLKHVPLKPCKDVYQTSGGYKRQWVRATGEASEPIVFTLRYRSREALQALGIIGEDGEGAALTRTPPNSDDSSTQRSRSEDTTEQNFNPIARPAISPTPGQSPGQAPGIPTPSASRGLDAEAQGPLPIRSLLSPGHGINDGVSAGSDSGNIRTSSSQTIVRSRNAEGKDQNTNSGHVEGPESESDGSGQGTPARHRGADVRCAGALPPGNGDHDGNDDEDHGEDAMSPRVSLWAPDTPRRHASETVA